MSRQGAETLYLPVRPRALLPYLGHIATALAALATVPLAVSVLSGSPQAAWRYLVVIAFLAAAGALLLRRPTPSDLQVNEGLVVIAGVFLVSPFVMAYPLTAHGLTYGQALFEAVSAVTTTGLSTLPTVEDRSEGFLFARAWMQWYGGLGIVTLLPLWLPPGPAARHLGGLDAPESGDPLSSARQHARRMLSVYLLLSTGGVFLLWTLGADPFTALVHTLAAISTGGFSSLDGSLAALPRPVALGTVFLSVLGALPFMFYIRLVHRQVRAPWTTIQVLGLLAMGGLGTLALALSMNAEGTGNAWDALLLAFSAQTTAGFTPLDVARLGSGTQYLLILMMIVGGALGSTAGGIKLIRLQIFLRLAQALVQRASLPRDAWMAPEIGGAAIDDDIAQRALLVMLLFLATVGLSWLPFLAAGVDPLDALFEVVSATATVGLSSGITQAGLPPFLQGVLCLDMWLGRLEVVAALVLLSPATWRR